jgi:hypothetical protein
MKNKFYEEVLHVKNSNYNIRGNMIIVENIA